MKKVYQPVGIVFKGSGFYATDHHSPSGQAARKADEKSESDGKSSGESKDTSIKSEASAIKSSESSSPKETSK